MSTTAVRVRVQDSWEQADGDWLVAMEIVVGEPSDGQVLQRPNSDAWRVVGAGFVNTKAHMAGRRLLFLRPLGECSDLQNGEVLEARQHKAEDRNQTP